MATTWTEVQAYENATSSTYDSVSVTYDQTDKNYNGQTITTWTNEIKS